MLVYIRAACLSSVHGGRGELYNWLPITTGAGDWCLVPGLVVLRLLTSHSDFHRTVQCIRLEVRCRRGWESFYYPASWLAGYITTSSHCKQANLYRLDTLILLSSSSQVWGVSPCFVLIPQSLKATLCQVSWGRLDCSQWWLVASACAPLRLDQHQPGRFALRRRCENNSCLIPTFKNVWSSVAP